MLVVLTWVEVIPKIRVLQHHILPLYKEMQGNYPTPILSKYLLGQLVLLHNCRSTIPAAIPISGIVLPQRPIAQVMGGRSL
jgi:hypothetical protein